MSSRSFDSDVSGMAVNVAIAATALVIVVTIYALAKAGELVVKAYRKDPTNPALLWASAAWVLAWVVPALAVGSVGAQTAGGIAAVGGALCSLLLLVVAAVVVLRKDTTFQPEREHFVTAVFHRPWWNLD